MRKPVLIFIFLIFSFISGAQSGVGSSAASGAEKNLSSGAQDRAFWVETAVKLADPVLVNLSDNTLKKNMPYRSVSDSRRDVSYLEAVGRLICGISPWLELGPDDTPEGRLRGKYIALAVRGLGNAVDPDAPDYLVFGEPHQPLVDAAFLAHGLLRAPTQLWGNFDDRTRQNMITELKRSRAIKPFESNWLLFASMVEAALLEFTGECDMKRLMYGVVRFRDEWYKGDGWYGDGPEFHLDYYNSYVIHPMLTDILMVLDKYGLDDSGFLETQLERHSRYAGQQERLISPEGTFPVIGRSITYRFGAFHALSHAALLGILPDDISPAQVRSALSAVIKNQTTPENFDGKGWLLVGFTGVQPKMSESYINTGSVYLCAMGLVSLGLPADDPFWSGGFTPWTNLKAWRGVDVPADKAIK